MTYIVRVDKQLSDSTVEATNKHEAMCYVLNRLSYLPMCIMPIVDRAEDMRISEHFIVYLAYLTNGSLQVECREVTA